MQVGIFSRRDKQGYKNGYDKNQFDRAWIHRLTLTSFDKNGHDRIWYAEVQDKVDYGKLNE